MPSAAREAPTQEARAAAQAVKVKAAPAPPAPEPEPEAEVAQEAPQSPVDDKATPAVIAGPTPPPAGPMAPHRVEWVDLPEYPGFKMKIWVNYPQATFDALFATGEGSAEASNEASKEIFIEHNGWRDHKGTPYPPMSDPAEFWSAIPNELGGLMVAVLRKQAGVLPNSLLPTRGR